MTLLLLAAGVALLAWSNGANDNFKGVATLYGSGTVSFKTARWVATLATGLGSCLSVLLAGRLLRVFSGKDLVPDSLIDGNFLAAVAVGSAAAILLATVIGMPTSTTHALTGALIGAGVGVAGWTGVSWSLLATKFAQPLLLSPLLAISLTAVAYAVLSRLRRASSLSEESCLCLEATEPLARPLAAQAGALATGGSAKSHTSLAPPRLSVRRDTEANCAGSVGVSLKVVPRRWLDACHLLSGASVCFARAVNDTPKIAALWMAAAAAGLGSPLFETGPAMLAVATAMAAGGYVQSAKVARTMSLEVVPMNRGQGATANLVTAALVLGASRLGVPVSTTHVSCGSLFGLGVATRSGSLATVARILMVWVTTLPLAALIALLTLLVRL